MLGRFFWASTSDYIGRRNTYMVFFVLGIVLYSLVPTFGHIGSIPLFVARVLHHHLHVRRRFRHRPGLFARYLRHDGGRRHSWPLLTAWSAAGVLGPVLVNYIRAYQIDNGVPKAQAYTITMYIMCALLLIGFCAISRCVRSILNITIRPERQAAPAGSKQS